MGDEAGEAVQDLKGRRELKAMTRKLDSKKKRRGGHCSVESEPRNPRSFWWREREKATSWAKYLHLSMWGLRMGKKEEGLFQTYAQTGKLRGEDQRQTLDNCGTA